MTSEGLGEMFEGDSADTCANKFLLVSMGGRKEGLKCVDPGATTPISASGNFASYFSFAISLEPSGVYLICLSKMRNTEKMDSLTPLDPASERGWGVHPSLKNTLWSV